MATTFPGAVTKRGEYKSFDTKCSKFNIKCALIQIHGEDEKGNNTPKACIHVQKNSNEYTRLYISQKKKRKISQMEKDDIIQPNSKTSERRKTMEVELAQNTDHVLLCLVLICFYSVCFFCLKFGPTYPQRRRSLSANIITVSSSHV